MNIIPRDTGFFRDGAVWHVAVAGHDVTNVVLAVIIFMLAGFIAWMLWPKR